mmetsp:Transcript_6358/g.20016  ORF Transcript_6358/g.20016 Transcript_6358/m.20016 type:complete len:351 (-) Transcript_6358:1023-2075(-)
MTENEHRNTFVAIRHASAVLVSLVTATGEYAPAGARITKRRCDTKGSKEKYSESAASNERFPRRKIRSSSSSSSVAQRLLRVERHVLRVVHLAAHEGVPALAQVVLVDLGVEQLRLPLLEHRHRDVVRHLPDLAHVREHAALVDLLVGDARGRRLRRRVEHLVGEALRAADGAREADAREDVHVVALRRDEGLALVLDRGERRPGGDDGAALGPVVRLLGGALRVGRRVRHRHDDRARRVLAELGDDALGEDAADAGEAEQAVRLVHREDVLQRRPVGDGVVVPLVPKLAAGVRVAVLAVGLADGAAVGDDDDAALRLLLRQARAHHGVDHGRGHALSGGAAAAAHDAQV